MDSRQAEPDSVEYWKKQAKYYEQKVNDIQQELDEYTENSAQLEKELEASLGQVEKQNRDLEHQNQRLKNEIENLRNKLERSQHETNALENELQALKIEKEKQAVYVRELEQKNDDLERGQRVISESVSYIEALLNQAYERNAVLESEIDEVENLRIKLQRATDEARDLKQELKVVDRVPCKEKDDSSSEIPAPVTNGHIIHPRGQVETETQTILSTPQKREVNGNAMTPASRVSAINIVGDLLRKVGLERFLCRECGKVKCTCDEPATAALPPEHPPQETIANDSDTIEFRNPRRASAGSSPPPLSLSSMRHSETPLVRETPFVRAGQGDGKLRRSFAVRSREGIENLLGFTRRNQDLKTNVLRK